MNIESVEKRFTVISQYDKYTASRWVETWDKSAVEYGRRGRERLGERERERERETNVYRDSDRVTRFTELQTRYNNFDEMHLDHWSLRTAPIALSR